MAKAKTTAFFCKECGYESSKWLGQCPACRAWNTLVEEPVAKMAPAAGKGRMSAERGAGMAAAKPALLSEIRLEKEDRISTGFKELDRVLGDGIVAGSLVLVGGDPGIGKSTLLLQVCRHLAAAGQRVLYISGEESLKQIKMRANRIGTVTGELRFLSETNLERIEAVIDQEKPQIVVIDSIQTMYREEITSAPGSVSQVRESTGILMQIAKSRGIAIFVVGHVTKEGVVAGPRVASGAVVSCSFEGTRPILLEVQALVAETSFGMPRRTAAGTDYNRVNLLMAVLEKRCRYELSRLDAYVNITGGMRMSEPALDLAIVMALMSSYKDRPVDPGMLIFGEVGLSGEVRGISQAAQRVAEAAKLGFTTCVLPKVNMEKIKPIDGIRMIGVSNVREAIGLL